MEKYIGGVIGIVIAVIVLFSVAIPVINEATSIKNTASVINESFQGEYDIPIQLTYDDIVPESEVVASTDGSTTYVRNTDYTMDYVNGTITILSTGSMLNNTAYYISYDYYYSVYTGTTSTMVGIIITMLALSGLIMAYAVMREFL